MKLKDWCEIIDTEIGKVVLVLAFEDDSFKLICTFNLMGFQVVTFQIDLGKGEKKAMKNLKAIKKKHLVETIKELEAQLFQEALSFTNIETTD